MVANALSRNILHDDVQQLFLRLSILMRFADTIFYDPVNFISMKWRLRRIKPFLNYPYIRQAIIEVYRD